MKTITKKILLSLAIIAIVASVVGNVYYFGWLNLQRYFLQKGFNIAVSQIVQTVQQTGQVQISKDLILIKK